MISFIVLLALVILVQAYWGRLDAWLYWLPSISSWWSEEPPGLKLINEAETQGADKPPAANV